jgi:hypothetical protein
MIDRRREENADEFVFYDGPPFTKRSHGLMQAR